MSLNSSEVISLREVCGSTPAEGAQPAEGTLLRKATKPLAPQALKAKRNRKYKKNQKKRRFYIFLNACSKIKLYLCGENAFSAQKTEKDMNKKGKLYTS